MLMQMQMQMQAVDSGPTREQPKIRKKSTLRADGCGLSADLGVGFVGGLI